MTCLLAKVPIELNTRRVRFVSESISFYLSATGGVNMARIYTDERAVCLECLCGEVFEPEKIVVDKYGDRCAVCPKCKALIRLAAKD